MLIKANGAIVLTTVWITDCMFRTNTFKRSGCILTNGASMANLFSTFINVRATEWRSNESTATFALIALANLCWRTVSLTQATRLARSTFVTNFAWQTIVVLNQLKKKEEKN